MLSQTYNGLSQDSFKVDVMPAPILGHRRYCQIQPNRKGFALNEERGKLI